MEPLRYTGAEIEQAGRTPGGKRRVNLMIAAIAVGDGAALATRNTADFEGLEPLLEVVQL